MKVDELSAQSRDFYERAKFKLSLSLIFAAFGMFLLGYAAAAGGTSAGNAAFSSQPNLGSKSILYHHYDFCLYLFMMLRACQHFLMVKTLLTHTML